MLEYISNYSTNNFFIIFLYFYLSIFFITLGKSFITRFFPLYLDSKNIKIYYSLTPVIGIFVFGNILVIFNFFIGLNNRFVYILFFIVFLITFYKNYKFLENFKIYLTNLTILLISSTNIGISKDADLYHLQNQAWIRDERIVFGLSNINPYLGYSSIFEYINSFLWLDKNYILIHFVSLYILASLFDLIFKFIRSDFAYQRKLGYVFLTIGIFDNFGFSGGRNGFLFIQETFKYDHIFSSLFMISILLFFVVYNNKYDSFGISILFIISIFAIQTRFLGHILLTLIIFLMFKKYPISLKSNFIVLTFYIVFVIKNFLYSSCLWFPVTFTCFKSAWYQPMQAKYISNLLINTNRFPNSKATDNILFTNFLEVFLNSNIDYLFNVFITLTILIFLFSILSRSIFINIYQVVISITLFFVWLYIAPTYRFGVPFFIGIYYVMCFLFINSEKKLQLDKLISKVSIPIYFFVLISIIRVDSILELQNYKDLNLFVEGENVEFIKVDDGWWLHPTKEGKFICGTYKNCYVESFKSKKINTLYNYYYFIPVNLNYYLEALN